MARATPVQVNFNAGELSPRLHARIDLAVRGNGVAEMVGFVPLMEGGAEACPGTIHVADVPNLTRLIPFEPNATQGHLLAIAATGATTAAHVFTNDTELVDANGAPVVIALPYHPDHIRAVDLCHVFDDLFLFHAAYPPQRLSRTGAATFTLTPLDMTGGPFDARNSDKTITVTASGVEGIVDLHATSAIFAAGDVGGLFQMEADDLGTIRSWEPGISVTVGQQLIWEDKVYRVVQGTRTGTVAPVHAEGVAWDGVGTGTDVNNQPAGGVRLEYVHDRIGQLVLTEYVTPQRMKARVTRRLPFTAAAAGAQWTGGYYPAITAFGGGGGTSNPDTNQAAEAPDPIGYLYGTWRWRFGSYSARRGWPHAGAVWNERLWLAKGNVLAFSAAGDFALFATLNELGAVSADMGGSVTVLEPNPIQQIVAGDRLLILTAGGVFDVGPSNAAAGVGPGNIRCVRQNDTGAAPGIKATTVDGRMLYVGKSRQRVIQSAFDLGRGIEDASDQTRYASHIGGRSRFRALAVMRDPMRLLWAVRDNGTLAVAAAMPEEQVLGWARRDLAPGIDALDIAVITGPDGQDQQLWIAADMPMRGRHLLRLAPFRADGARAEPTVMTDLSVIYSGAPKTTFTSPLFANRRVEIVADDRWITADADASGSVTLETPASDVVMGLAFDAVIRTLPIEAGGESGPALTKTRRVQDAALVVSQSRGLMAQIDGGPVVHIEGQRTDSSMNTALPIVDGIQRLSGHGVWDESALTIARAAPFPATVLALQVRVMTHE